ncbi:MAG: ABC transporter ATP-binding protein [Bacteroidia bacterium]
MMSAVIKVEHIGKKYRLDHLAKKEEDLFIKSAKNQIKNLLKKRKEVEEFWALKDVSFEIQKGDRVGIIGRNGAGKSTLLKILSRIVTPTTGRIEYEGQIASLLEVGTGFHGDLTGRENIYLNGSILGMSKQEITKKFDEIVDFSEVEQFLDTPVKRYSSGMYVRLAFAVAAHLEPDILIVDEVLAVGDSAFQKKCLGKMQDVSTKEGRTILFVSHNLGQISSLCNKAILLNKGMLENEGTPDAIINQYFNSGKINDDTEFFFEPSKEKEFGIRSIKMLNSKKEKHKNFAHNEPMLIEVEVEKNRFLNDVILGIYFSDTYDKKIFTTQIAVFDKFENKNTSRFLLTVPGSVLVPNTYNFTVALHIPNIQVLDEKQNISQVHIYDNGSEFYKYMGSDVGQVFVNCKWEVA